eukprot:TRINITY_DN4630_c0_g1_i1.p1 TRINITY_DN4630_c0_g1~~TRINITY_DN4630_c0_g1_i1.p1  ORF type:complete len:634 (+),score=208.33 TRINITY_DN4630_c0_g1_i1:584-2485(+)
MRRKLNTQIPLFKEALNKIRDMVDGQIPEDVVTRLRRMPQDELHPNEWMMVQAWDIIQPLRKELESHQKEIGRLRDDVRSGHEKQGKVLSELENAQRLVKEKDDEDRRRGLNYDNMKKNMEMELEKAYENVDLLRKKAEQTDKLALDMKKLMDENEVLRNKIDLMEHPQKFKEQIVNQVFKEGLSNEDLKRRYQLLEKDKEFLARENIDIMDKNKRMEDKISKLEQELLDSKRQTNDYLQKLLTTKDHSIVEYEKKINKEILELREKHAIEIDLAKKNLIDIYEKQLQFLKENKQELEIKVDSLNLQLKEKQNSHDQLLLENRTIQRRVENDVAEARIQHRIKTEELDRMTHIYEETLASLKAAKLENDMLREKLNVLKAEYYKAEANGKQEAADVKAQLAFMREKVLAYEAIEKEIDATIVNLADGGREGESTLNMAPTLTKRRIQQALSLAQKLSDKTKECEELKKALEDLRAREGQLQEEFDSLKDLMSKTNQPYNYLITNIEEKDKEIKDLRGKLKNLDQDYQNNKAELQRLKLQLEERDYEIKRLMIKRENIQNIQRILANLVNNERHNMRNTDVNQLMNDIQNILNKKDDPFSDDKYATVRQGNPGIGGSDTQRREPPQWYSKLRNK